MTKWWPKFASSSLKLKGEASFWSKFGARKSTAAAASRENLSEVCLDGEQLQIVT